MNILITGASGDAAQGVIRSLRRADKEYTITSTCIYPDNVGFFMSDHSFVVPNVSSRSSYVSCLIDIMLNNKIDVLIPCIDSEIELISNHRLLIEEKTQSKVLIGAPSSVLICSDKLKMFDFLRQQHLPTPECITEYPKLQELLYTGADCVCKPRCGGGSSGQLLINQNSPNIPSYLDPNYIYQEKLPFEREITSVVMKESNSVFHYAAFERKLRDGRTIYARTTEVNPIHHHLSTLANNLDIPYFNVQFGVIDQTYYIFDINPRFSGSTSLFSLIFNGPHLLCQQIKQGTMPSFNHNTSPFSSMRYYEDFVIGN